MTQQNLGSKLEDIINKVNKQFTGASQNVVGGAINTITNVGQGVVGAANNLLKMKASNPAPRLPSYPVASMEGGYVMNNDGTQGYGPDMMRLNVLRKNVLDQLPFTPQAQRFIENLPLYSEDMGKGMLGVTSTSRPPMSPPQVDYRDVGISPRVFAEGHPQDLPAEVATHEFLHTLDRNISPGQDNTGNPIPQNSNNSQGFYGSLEEISQNLGDEINSFLSSYKNAIAKQGGYIKDTEGFAQTGALLGPDALTSPVGNFYDQIFAPVDKPMNYSPVFPTKSFLDRMKMQDDSNFLHE